MADSNGKEIVIKFGENLDTAKNKIQVIYLPSTIDPFLEGIVSNVTYTYGAVKRIKK